MYWEISRPNWLLRYTNLVYFNFVKIGTVQFVQCCCRSMYMVNCCALGLQCFSHLRFLGKDYSLKLNFMNKKERKTPLHPSSQAANKPCLKSPRIEICQLLCCVRIWRFWGDSEHCYNFFLTFQIVVSGHADHSSTIENGGDRARSLSYNHLKLGVFIWVLILLLW